MIELTQLCPGLYGSCIYQARALYNSIYKTATIFPECYWDESAKKGQFGNNGKIQNEVNEDGWEVKLIPNPASEQLKIETTNESEYIDIHITDLSGRNVFNQRLRLNGRATTIDLSLAKGAYFITLNAGNNRITTKKLLIAE
jgi:hypothetical protein